MSVNQRLWHGLSYDAYVTWASSKGYYTPDDTVNFTGNGLQDPNNIAGSNGPLEGTPRKMFKGSFNYAIPGGHFHKPWLRGALSGWTLRGITGWRSGIPLNVTSGNDYVGNGRSAGQRPDDVPTVNPYIENVSKLQWFARSAFSMTAVKAQKRFGNLGFNAVWGPTAFTLDSGLHKTFDLTEKQHLTLRIEAFNALNHVTLGNPNTSSSIAALSASSLPSEAPRLYQLALKYVF